jgi:predicted SAM-dependent methyltransferase
MNKNIKLFKPYFNLKKNIVIWIKKINTPKIVDTYFNNHNVVKIHLGCGGRVFKNWLNCDINLQSDCYVDLNKRLPFKDSSVDYIYSEHVLEHFDYQKGKEIIEECYRVLKPNGIVRISMPDLDFYLENMSNEIDPEIQDFIMEHKKSFIELKDCPSNMNTMLNFIINSCGHKYVYRAQTFIKLAKELGFKNAMQVEPGRSEYEEFDYLEDNTMGRHAGAKNHLIQTMALEANK